MPLKFKKKLLRISCVLYIFVAMYVCTPISGHIYSDLVTESMGKSTAVLVVRSVYSEKIITYNDGHSTQDERSKQVGVDIVAGATQFPMTKHTQNNNFPPDQKI